MRASGWLAGSAVFIQLGCCLALIEGAARRRRVSRSAKRMSFRFVGFRLLSLSS